MQGSRKRGTFARVFFIVLDLRLTRLGYSGIPFFCPDVRAGPKRRPRAAIRRPPKAHARHPADSFPLDMPARPPACRSTPCPTGSTSRPILFFLTRRIEYFRTAAPSLANTRKSETFDNKVHPCDASPHGRPKTRFSPLYDTFRGYFSAEKWPWIEISMGWIGDSMGWKSKSMGWIDCAAAWKHENNAKRRTKVAVRINALPYSAQRFPCGAMSAA